MIDIKWDDKYLVGHPRIDHEHQIFVDLIRTISQGIDEPSSRERNLRLLMEVKKYAEFHFFSEENVMLDVGFPELDQHRQEHMQLLSELDNELYLYRVGEGKLEHTVNFMFEWFALHTSNSDRHLTRFINQGNPKESDLASVQTHQ